MPLTIRDTLLWYKRPEVRAAMIEGARNKEIGVRYGDGFGKRPDSLEYEQEVLEAVQRGATSFHASEETWSNPKAIETGMSKERTADLRTGWDLVLDIDFTNFEATKLITHALCQELEAQGVEHYGVKFSGNKGFHIGVAWESFPAELDGKPVAQQFPDAARLIADYLVFSIDNPDNGFALSEKIRVVMPLEQAEEHMRTVCGGCGRVRVAVSVQRYFICGKCHTTESKPADFDGVPSCPKCANPFMTEHREEAGKDCVCGSKETRRVFDLKIDTQLVSSRHLYRLEYSLHEKSGLASIPILADHVLTFERGEATPDKVTSFPAFWSRAHSGEGYLLFIRAHAFKVPDSKDNEAPPREVVWDGDAAPEELFPPTIRNMLAGLKDGKKRSMFVLTNFLRSIGWNYDMITQRLGEWNEKNDPPLREQELKGHIRYHKQRGTLVLPPNFDNELYKDLGVLEHDELSARVKNPVQYVRLKLKQQGPPKKDKN